MRNALWIILISAPLFAGSPHGFPVDTTVVVGPTPVTALAANPNRGYLIVQNNGTGNCQIKFGSAITGTEGLIIGSGQNYETVEAFTKSPVYMKCAVAGSSICILETNY